MAVLDTYERGQGQDVQSLDEAQLNGAAVGYECLLGWPWNVAVAMMEAV